MNERKTRPSLLTRWARQRRRRRLASRPALSRLALEAMTLVEIMIVVIIMALIATAVGIAVLPRLEKARIDSTRTDAQSVRSAATMYVSENAGDGCPSTEDLTGGGYLDSSRRTVDAWDNEFSIECEGTDIIVISAGPDEQMGTEDDIQ